MKHKKGQILVCLDHSFLFPVFVPKLCFYEQDLVINFLYHCSMLFSLHTRNIFESSVWSGLNGKVFVCCEDFLLNLFLDVWDQAPQNRCQYDKGGGEGFQIILIFLTFFLSSVSECYFVSLQFSFFCVCFFYISVIFGCIVLIIFLSMLESVSMFA